MGSRTTASRSGGGAAEQRQARELATGARARAALGAPVADELGRLLDSTSSVARPPDRPDEEQAAFRSAIERTNRALKQQHEPYYLDGEALMTAQGATPLLLSYYVQSELEVLAAERSIRVVELWRLDELNVRHPYLGYTRPSTPAALVLLDQVEVDLIRDVLPAVAPGEVMVLVDPTTEVQAPAWASELGQGAGAAVRQHYASLAGVDHAALERLGPLLARRRALVKKWRASVRGLGFELVVPARLVPEADYAQELKNRVPTSELIEWDELHDDLLAPENYQLFLDLRRRYTAAVRRHEVQHRIDFDAGLIAVPELIAKRLGLENPLDAPATGLAGRARDELSAYLAAIAHDPDSPTLEFVLLMRHLFHRDTIGGPYSYAALAALEGIATELGIPVEAALRPHIQPARLTPLVLAVIQRPPAELRRAASAVYERAYGRALPNVTIKARVDHPDWRH